MIAPKRLDQRGETRVNGWSFAPADFLTRDGERIEAGRIYRLPQGVEPEIRRRGFQAARQALDALFELSDTVALYAELGGAILESRWPRLLCASEQRVLALASATRGLQEYACDVAEAALDLHRAAGREPDPRSYAAIAVKRRWLDGACAEAELVEASDAARIALRRAWEAAWETGDAGWAAHAAARAAYDVAYARDGQMTGAVVGSAREAASWGIDRWETWEAVTDVLNAQLEARLRRLLALGA